ncbi:hypothetical protein [Phenylobacterium sp.]|uniref:COG4705 family protein n=1 Tax=Phenylobacterium sp. TaxID=1871053 RepID=UPI0035B4823F
MSKVPQITLAFWVLKILATTLGETGGDLVSMTLGLGYVAATGLFFAVFLALASGQVLARRFHPFLYWGVVLATTTVGTTISDFLDRTAGLGYLGGALVLAGALIAVLVAWRLTLGAIASDHISDRRHESFYWLTILVSNTLGTALGDFLADDSGLGYGGGALLIGALIAAVAGAHRFTRLPKTLLFWVAFVLTRPLGATVGDLLSKPHAKGGLDLGTIPASALIALAVVAGVAVVYRGGRGAAGASA